MSLGTRNGPPIRLRPANPALASNSIRAPLVKWDCYRLRAPVRALRTCFSRKSCFPVCRGIRGKSGKHKIGGFLSLFASIFDSFAFNKAIFIRLDFVVWYYQKGDLSYFVGITLRFASFSRFLQTEM